MKNIINTSSILLNIVLCAVLLPQISLGQQTINGTILHDGLQREYILYIPDSYSPNESTPLLFNFHGYKSNAFEQMNYGDFRPIADTANFLIVHPMGTVDALGNTHWNVGWGTSTTDDLGFASALIDSLAIDYNIDPDRIYSTGMSNGGFMSYLLACELSNRIAAIASVTGSMNVGQFESCSCEHPMAIMEIHGTADASVPYNGSYLFEPIEDVVNYWVVFNGCNTSPQVTDMPDLDPTDGSTVKHYLYTDGNQGIEVEHYKVINGTHTWPGSQYDIGGTNYDINASIEIWKFLSKYDINGLINATALNEINKSESSIIISPNPCLTSIQIEGNFAYPTEYQIISLLGETLQGGVLSSNHQRLDLSLLPSNIYFIKVDGSVFRVLKL
jgi:polyhydroxybutyrate depolymerase